MVAGVPRNGRAVYVIWWSFVFAYLASVVVFFVADRYMVPFFVAMCVGSGATIDALISAARERDWKTASVTGAAVAILVVFVSRPLVVDEGIAEERTRMAERLITLDRYDEAERWAAKAEPISSRPGVLHFRLAERYLARDRQAAALD